MNILPFLVQYRTIAINVTTIASASRRLPGQGNTMRVVNDGNKTVFISVGLNPQGASVPDGIPIQNGTPIRANSDAIFSLPSDSIYDISAICGSGTSIIYVQVGEGA